jgi:hypothetical protein
MTNPTRFRFSIGGHMGESFSIELRNGILEYERFAQGYLHEATESISPAPGAWESFITAADRLSLWDWLPSYHVPTVDGTNWQLLLEQGGRLAQSSGSNGYPDDTDLAVTVHNGSGRFTALLEAVSALLGGRPIH